MGWIKKAADCFLHCVKTLVERVTYIRVGSIFEMKFTDTVYVSA